MIVTKKIEKATRGRCATIYDDVIKGGADDTAQCRLARKINAFILPGCDVANSNKVMRISRCYSLLVPRTPRKRSQARPEVLSTLYVLYSNIQKVLTLPDPIPMSYQPKSINYFSTINRQNIQISLIAIMRTPVLRFNIRITMLQL